MHFVLGKYRLGRRGESGGSEADREVVLWLAVGFIAWQAFGLVSLYCVGDVILRKYISAGIVAVVAVAGVAMLVWKAVKYRTFDILILALTLLAVIAVFSDLRYITEMSALLDGN